MTNNSYSVPIQFQYVKKQAMPTAPTATAWLAMELEQLNKALISAGQVLS